MELTAGQEAAVRMVDELLKEDGVFGVLTGFAGTGKTTMLRVLAERYGVPQILCPTGKAALRVTEATDIRAMTIHRWLYDPREDPKTGLVLFTPKGADKLHVPLNGFIIVDEASMVSRREWENLWGTCKNMGLRVLLVGDRFQLPPVEKTEEGFTKFSTLTDLDTPYRAELTEVVRQAQDNPIIKASMLIRQSPDATLDAIQMLDKVDESELVNSFLAMDPDRFLICHRNKTRHDLNLKVRAAMGYNPIALQTGEPLLVLVNNYDLDRYNGEVLTFDGWNQIPSEPVAVVDRRKHTSHMMGFGVANVGARLVTLSEEEVFVTYTSIDRRVVKTAARRLARDVWGYEKSTEPPHLNAELGYALTAHKAQGSQANDVLVAVEQSLPGGLYGYEGRRWIYTAITRSVNNVKLCLF